MRGNVQYIMIVWMHLAVAYMLFSDVFSVFTAYCFTICHPTCCSANRSAFSGSLAGQTLSGNLISAELYSKSIFGLPKIGHNILWAI